MVTLHTPEPPLSSTLTSGNSQPTTAVGSSLNKAESIHSRASSIPPTPTTPSTRRGSVDRPSSAFGHRKAKSSADGNGTIGRAPSDRMGGLLSGALSRNRKPAPRYPSYVSRAGSYLKNANPCSGAPRHKTWINLQTMGMIVAVSEVSWVGYAIICLLPDAYRCLQAVTRRRTREARLPRR